MREPEPEELCQDLTGDPVFEYLKRQVLSDHRLVGGRIIEPDFFGPKGARIIIEVIVEHNVTKKITVCGYNYKKMRKALKAIRIPHSDDC